MTKTVNELLRYKSVLIFFLLSMVNHLIGQNSQGNVYDVGYTSFVTYDSLRQENSPHTFLGLPNNANRYRPLLIHVWYPSIAKDAPLHMSDRAYHFVVEEFLNSRNYSEREKDSIEHAMLVDLEEVEPKVKSIFRARSKAQKNRLPIEKKFPLVIHAGHVKAQWRYNEQMAQLGCIVISVDALTTPYQELSSTKDIAFAINFLSKNTKLDYTRMVGIGSGYGSALILGFQMSNAILDGIISFDGTDHWKGYLEKCESQLPLEYDPKKINIPYLRVFRQDSLKVDFDFHQMLKYADHHLVELTEDRINHGFIQYPHTVLNYRDQKLVEASKYLLKLKKDLTISFIESIKNNTSNFFNKNLKEDSHLSYHHIPKIKTPPNRNEIKILMNQQGQQALQTLLQQYLKEDSNFIDYNLLFLLGRDYTWSGEVEKGLPYLEIAKELFPHKFGAYIELLKASTWIKNSTLNQKYKSEIETAKLTGVLQLSKNAQRLVDKYTLTFKQK